MKWAVDSYNLSCCNKFLKKRLNGGKMKTISKLLLAISFAISVTTSAFAVTVCLGVELTQSLKS